MQPRDLDEFTDACASACRMPVASMDKTIGLVMRDDEEDGLLVLGIETGDDVHETIKAMFVGRHDFAGFATKVSWSPDDITPFFPCWCLTTVQRDMPARVSILKQRSRQAWNVPLEHAPWFALSTAGAMRGWLDGEFTEIKQVQDDRLFGTVFDEAPPTDEKGHI